MIKVLIVEDSRVVSEYLFYILSQDPRIQVIGNVSNGKKAIEFIKEYKPDVITMDIDMPIMDGLEATRIIMSTTPIPILIVTGSRNANEVDYSIEALAYGALAIIEKPLGLDSPKADALAKKLINLVKLMSEVPVITRRIKAPVNTITAPATILKKIRGNEIPLPEIVAIGVSSGGPQTLKIVFSAITSKFPAPIVVVQHIAAGFISGLVSWMQNTLNIPVHLAANAQQILPGNIYFAPDGYQMGVSSKGKIILEKCESNNGFCPSVASLFKSVASEYGNKAIGAILTGMGSDGAKELKLIHDTGALTIAQSKESALIYGMPNVAVQLGAAKLILSAEEIALFLKEIELNYGKA